MPRSINIAKVTRGGGKLAVRFANKTGHEFTSLAQAQAILDGFRDAFSTDVLFLLGVDQVGLANSETLEGKTITLDLKVTIA